MRVWFSFSPYWTTNNKRQHSRSDHVREYNRIIRSLLLPIRIILRLHELLFEPLNFPIDSREKGITMIICIISFIVIYNAKDYNFFLTLILFIGFYLTNVFVFWINYISTCNSKMPSYLKLKNPHRYDWEMKISYYLG